jgi:hypothetical protein
LSESVYQRLPSEAEIMKSASTDGYVATATHCGLLPPVWTTSGWINALAGAPRAPDRVKAAPVQPPKRTLTNREAQARFEMATPPNSSEIRRISCGSRGATFDGGCADLAAPVGILCQHAGGFCRLFGPPCGGRGQANRGDGHAADAWAPSSGQNLGAGRLACVVTPGESSAPQALHSSQDRTLAFV